MPLIHNTAEEPDDVKVQHKNYDLTTYIKSEEPNPVLLTNTLPETENVKIPNILKLPPLMDITNIKSTTMMY